MCPNISMELLVFIGFCNWFHDLRNVAVREIAVLSKHDAGKKNSILLKHKS